MGRKESKNRKTNLTLILDSPLAICWRGRNFFPVATRTSQRPSSRNQGKGGKHLPRQRKARKSAKSIVARSVELLKRLPQNGLKSFLKQHSYTVRAKEVNLSPPFDYRQKSQSYFRPLLYSIFSGWPPSCILVSW